MEELLRKYFLKSGYYVVRGVPFIYEGFEVTDIDIWLYGRTSSFSREIIIVDSKNKKTPQAIERIFWVQGLRIATMASSAIVATTDRRQEVKDFGKKLNVTVLDGTFLSRLVSSDNSTDDRLTDEEFSNAISSYELSKLDGDWKARLKFSKSLLSTGLSFDSCNKWLIEAKFFAEQSITKTNQHELALRCLYLICSFVAVSIDFVLKEISFQEQPERIMLIKDGITYGSRGNAGVTKMINLAMGLVEQHAKDGKLISQQVRNSVEHQFEQLNTGILAEYFSRSEVSRSLFSVAKELEKMAMNREFLSHHTASVETKGLLFCLLDYWGISRTYFIK
ncbi:hypothetical protein [Pedobacter xixiisoli]|nr:hypothetical protein [Pedobacter xixiisoli]